MAPTITKGATTPTEGVTLELTPERTPERTPEATPTSTPVPEGVLTTKAPSKALIQAARLWHVRLGHISLDLLKKTTQITKGMPDFKRVRPEDLVYKSYDLAKLLRRPSKKLVEDPPNALGRIEGDIFVIRPTPLNNRDRKSVV